GRLSNIKRGKLRDDEDEVIDLTGSERDEAGEEDIDLNVTQPLATRESGRPTRHTILPKVLHSPYVVKEVSLIYGITPHKNRAADCLFSASDIVFKTKYVDVPRSVLERYEKVCISQLKKAGEFMEMADEVLDEGLAYNRMDPSLIKLKEMRDQMFTRPRKFVPGVDIASGAIDLFTHVLNEAEKSANVHTVKRLFCHTTMVTSDMRGWNYDRAREKFNERKEDVLRSNTYKNLHGVHLIVRVFVMRHMETYKGDWDCCGLSREGSEHINELIDLRRKYAVKILLADCKHVKKEFELETYAFKTLAV
nr:hypothetical protein [Tanacetum cinerariifolium]